MIPKASDYNRVFESLYGEVRYVIGKPLAVPNVFVPGNSIRLEEFGENIDAASAALADYRRSPAALTIAGAVRDFVSLYEGAVPVQIVFMVGNSFRTVQLPTTEAP